MLLTCPICNRSNLKSLTNHCKRTHGVSKSELIEKYGVIKFLCDEAYENYSNATKRKWEDPEYSNKMKEVGSQVLKDLWSNSEFRERKSAQQSEMVKEMWKDEHYRELFINNINNLWSDPEHRRLMSEYLSKRWDNPEYRDMMVRNNSQLMKELWNKEGFREFMSEYVSDLMKELWSNEEYRESMRTIRHNELVERWKDPEYRNKILDLLMSFPHANMKVYTTPEGIDITMRSSWEVEVAKFLDASCIKYEYENYRFKYEYEGLERTYIPDFYLKDFNLFIEVKPKCYIEDEVIQLKKNSVINKGYNFMFITEDNVWNLEESFKSLLESATTIESIT